MACIHGQVYRCVDCESWVKRPTTQATQPTQPTLEYYACDGVICGGACTGTYGDAYWRCQWCGGHYFQWRGDGYMTDHLAKCTDKRNGHLNHPKP